MRLNTDYYQTINNIGAEYDYGLRKVRAVSGFIRSIYSVYKQKLDSVPSDIIEIIRGFVSVEITYRFDINWDYGKQILMNIMKLQLNIFRIYLFLEMKYPRKHQLRKEMVHVFPEHWSSLNKLKNLKHHIEWL